LRKNNEEKQKAQKEKKEKNYIITKNEGHTFRSQSIITLKKVRDIGKLNQLVATNELSCFYTLSQTLSPTITIDIQVEAPHFCRSLFYP